MRTRCTAVALAFALAAVTALPAAAQSEIPAGTRFVVELRDKLDAKKIKVGKKFDARTLEALRATDGSVIEAGARLKGRVAYVEDKKVVLRFEEIDTRRGWVPIVAQVSGVVGEKQLKQRVGSESEISAQGTRGRNAAIGAAIGAGAGAAVGASKAGSQGAMIGAATGAAAGALIGAASGGRDLVLTEGTRVELTLDRPLFFKPRR
jgi:hypothetical protein